MRLGRILAVLLAATASASAFYLPGAAPHDYKKGDPVDLFVNALTPMLSGQDNAKLVRCVIVTSWMQLISFAEILDKLYE